MDFRQCFVQVGRRTESALRCKIIDQGSDASGPNMQEGLAIPSSFEGPSSANFNPTIYVRVLPLLRDRVQPVGDSSRCVNGVQTFRQRPFDAVSTGGAHAIAIERLVPAATPVSRSKPTEMANAVATRGGHLARNYRG